jgi:hypothetical protein
MSLFRYDTANNICTKKSLPVPARQTGAYNETTMNRINAKDKFVNDGQMET